MSKPYKELPTLVKLALKQGYPVRGGRNGGGWFVLAASCGYSDEVPITKTTARNFLRDRLQYKPPWIGVKADKKTSAVKALEAKLSTGNNWGSANSPDFLNSWEWRQLRMKALKLHGSRCQCCGATPSTGAVMNVDHIKPRRLYPMLALELDNLQVLCHECNHGKGNWDQTDWRPKPEEVEEVDPDVLRFLKSF